ncbi:hypothetical protein CEXT_445271 [Caerostris extrusa]|uniref:Uncharacterized protein n=1 Tax=Caerostris extrusa TaxID=172846 RepID=A0AAV4XH83_CAEEX|nr:hypothetical protein CEXT_445271 [Caerostris extrusa]
MIADFVEAQAVFYSAYTGNGSERVCADVRGAGFLPFPGRGRFREEFPHHGPGNDSWKHSVVSPPLRTTVSAFRLTACKGGEREFRFRLIGRLLTSRLTGHLLTSRFRLIVNLLTSRLTGHLLTSRFRLIGRLLTSRPTGRLLTCVYNWCRPVSCRLGPAVPTYKIPRENPLNNLSSILYQRL